MVSGLVDAFAKISPYLNFAEAQGPLFDLTLNTGEEWAQLLVSGLIWLVLPLSLGHAADPAGRGEVGAVTPLASPA